MLETHNIVKPTLVREVPWGQTRMRPRGLIRCWLSLPARVFFPNWCSVEPMNQPLIPIALTEAHVYRGRCCGAARLRSVLILFFSGHCSSLCHSRIRSKPQELTARWGGSWLLFTKPYILGQWLSIFLTPDPGPQPFSDLTASRERMVLSFTGPLLAPHPPAALAAGDLPPLVSCSQRDDV